MVKTKKSRKGSKILPRWEEEEDEEQKEPEQEHNKRKIQEDSLVDPKDVVNAFSQNLQYEIDPGVEQSEFGNNAEIMDVNALDKEYFDPFIRDGGVPAVDVVRLPTGKFMTTNPIKRVRTESPTHQEAKYALKLRATRATNSINPIVLITML